MSEAALVGPGRYLERVVVGVFGNMQHGKNTVADMICDEMDVRRVISEQFALADPLKRVAIHLLGMPAKVAWGAGIPTTEREHLRLSWSKYGRNGREWLQWIGTELGRTLIDAELWVDRAVDTIVMNLDGAQVFVISDCRFNNERTSLERKLEQRFIKFYKAKVYRPGVPIDLSHPSESEVAAMPVGVFDKIIDNDSDLSTLQRRVGLVCDELEGLLSLGVTE